MVKGTKYARERTVTCAVCGNDFNCSWTTTECCSPTCRRTLGYWSEKGIARARARISTYRAQIAELERVCVALDKPQPTREADMVRIRRLAPEARDEIVRRYRNYLASGREATEDSPRSLADHYGVTPQAVHEIVRAAKQSEGRS